MNKSNYYKLYDEAELFNDGRAKGDDLIKLRKC